METYLITGASRGIGKAIAVKIADKDKLFYLHGRDQKALADTCKEVEKKGAGAQAILADLSKPEGVEKLVSEVKSKTLSVLVNNAGIGLVKPFEKLTLEEWQKILAINLTAPFLLCQKLLPKFGNGSAIVNILSIAARAGFPNWSSYCASKFGLDGFSRAIREELRPRGVRVINVYPAAVDTEIWDKVPGQWPKERMLPASEVAEAVAYALSRPAKVMVEEIRLGDVSGRI